MSRNLNVTVEDLLEHRAWAESLARSLVKDPTNREDLIQDVYLTVIERPARGVGAVRGFLAGMFRNRSLAAHRAKARRTNRERAVAAGAAAHESSTADAVARTEARHLLVEATLCLPPASRDAIILRYFDDLPPRTISARLGVPVSTVESRIQRGLSRLRSELSRRYGGDEERWIAVVLPLIPMGLRPVAIGGSVLVAAGLCVAIGSAFLEAATDPMTQIASLSNAPLVIPDGPPPAPPKPVNAVTQSLGRFLVPPEPLAPAPKTPEPEDPPKRIWEPVPPSTDVGISPSGWPGMVRIPAGTAIIGLSIKEAQARNESTSPAELAVFAASTPSREVEVEEFWIDRTEVTNRQWQTYLKETGQTASEDLIENLWPSGSPPDELLDHPVTYVSAEEAEAYAAWCGKRLPTEVEWEYAARGSAGRIYPYGETFDPDRVVPKGKLEPRAVGSFPTGATPEGALDLTGNVWEWTASPMIAYPNHRPFDITTSFGRESVSGTAFFSSSMRVIRGGCYDSVPRALASYIRQPVSPHAWYSSIGFRCVRSSHPGKDALRRAAISFGALHPPMALDLVGSHWIQRNFDNGMGRVTFLAVAAVRDPDLEGRRRWHNRVLGVVVSNEPLLDPDLPPGAYLIEETAKGDLVLCSHRGRDVPLERAELPSTGVILFPRSVHERSGEQERLTIWLDHPEAPAAEPFGVVLKF